MAWKLHTTGATAEREISPHLGGLSVSSASSCRSGKHCLLGLQFPSPVPTPFWPARSGQVPASDTLLPFINDLPTSARWPGGRRSHSPSRVSFEYLNPGKSAAAYGGKSGRAVASRSKGGTGEPWHCFASTRRPTATGEKVHCFCCLPLLRPFPRTSRRARGRHWASRRVLSAARSHRLQGCVDRGTHMVLSGAGSAPAKGCAGLDVVAVGTILITFRTVVVFLTGSAFVYFAQPTARTVLSPCPTRFRDSRSALHPTFCPRLLPHGSRNHAATPGTSILHPDFHPLGDGHDAQRRARILVAHLIVIALVRPGALIVHVRADRHCDLLFRHRVHGDDAPRRHHRPMGEQPNISIGTGTLTP